MDDLSVHGLDFPVYEFGDNSYRLELCIDLDWLCCYYQDEDYAGSGTAFAKKNGKLFKTSLGHCSCHGPWEENEWKEVTAEDVKQFAMDELSSAIQQTNESFCHKLLELMEHE